ncbi:hypothetical protein JAAARDRAFT_29627 [Jaapia argillacea MUCL 33604]|uniref:Uncharacterized protein n=1 Tax=Jaapia argillacea MUCL 33604 TaxID=933084 RepID=A0A067QLT9_9AGAM|nr:hypothetical protein JAAARDRAFT_29627 [Jaapia argillacea MUCL 33604]
MAHPPTRETLESMKRIDLQRLCKDYGVKANLKSEALIDLILDASGPRTSAPPQRSTSIRVASRSGSRPRDRSTGSVIIHSDSEDEIEDGSNPSHPNHQPPDPPAKTDSAPPEPESSTATSRLPRTRKAKDTQLRLGVGRPAVAGGSGARAVTKIPVVLKSSKRTKSSKTFKSTEADIPEEEPEQHPSTPDVPPLPVDPLTPGPSGTNHDRDEHADKRSSSNVPPPPLGLEASSISIDRVGEVVAQWIKPLEERIQSQRFEIERLSAQVADVEELRLRVENLKAEVERLSGQAADSDNQLKGMRQRLDAAESHMAIALGNRPGPSAFNFADASVVGPSNFRTPGPQLPSRPNIPPTTLGKRHRDSTTSNITGVYEPGQEEDYSESELAGKVLRPEKKRVKLLQEDEDDDGSGSRKRARRDEEELEEHEEDIGGSFEDTFHRPRVPSFTIFTGSAYEPPDDFTDPPPPTTHLPHSYASPSSSSPIQRDTPGPGVPTTSTANASENQNQHAHSHPFSFNFGSGPVGGFSSSGVPSTPYVPSFPYPEPPLSPSPPTRRHHHQPSPNPNKPPATMDPRSALGVGSSSGFINPSALMRPSAPSTSTAAAGQGVGGLMRSSSSNDVGFGLGMTSVPSSGNGTDTPGQPMRRTMYGTELEGDTRFGDFGVEGVATGFWNPSTKF